MQPESENEQGGAAVKTLAKGLAVLDLLIKNGSVRTGDVAERLGLDKGGTSRLLQTLAAAGYAERAGGRSYRVGPRILALRRAPDGELRARARPLLEQLAAEVGECAYLGIAADAQVLYLDKADIAAPLKVDHPIGTLAPLDRTALGKVLLAFGRAALPPDVKANPEVEARLQRTLDQIVGQGVAIDDEERAPGVRCVAAPLRNADGEVIAAIAVAGPSSRIPTSRLETLAETVKRFAAAFTTPPHSDTPRVGTDG